MPPPDVGRVFGLEQAAFLAGPVVDPAGLQHALHGLALVRGKMRPGRKPAFQHRSYLTILAGEPTTTALSGTSRNTVDPAPTVTFAPIATPWMT